MAVLGSTSLTGCNSIPDFIATSSLMLFQQTSAPVNWTKQTTHNNKALRVVSGTATPGGSTAFTSVFTSRPISGTVGNHTLTSSQIPSHTHPRGADYPGTRQPALTNGLPATPTPSYTAPNFFSVNPASSGQNSPADGSHDHPFSATALDFAVSYVDLIICSKN